MKQIIKNVRFCAECYLIGRTKDMGSEIVYCQLKGGPIENEMKIPEWCPLPDKQED